MPKAIGAAEFEAYDSRFALRTDIESFYPSCQRDAVAAYFARHFHDRAFVALLEQLLTRSILDDSKEVTKGGLLPGCPLSALGAEIYIAPAIGELWDAGIRPVRYVDDIFVGCESRRDACKAKDAICAALDKRGLRLAAKKTRTYDLRGEGAPFLGFRIFRFYFSPDLDRAKGLAATIRRVSSERDLRSVVRGQVRAYDRGVARKEFWSAVKRSARRPEATKLINSMVRPARAGEPEAFEELRVLLNRVRSLEREYAQQPHSKFGCISRTERLFIIEEIEKTARNT